MTGTPGAGVTVVVVCDVVVCATAAPVTIASATAPASNIVFIWFFPKHDTPGGLPSVVTARWGFTAAISRIGIYSLQIGLVASRHALRGSTTTATFPRIPS
jgi:hypothetical protein